MEKLTVGDVLGRYVNKSKLLRDLLYLRRIATETRQNGFLVCILQQTRLDYFEIISPASIST